jgi:hypothetical protein
MYNFEIKQKIEFSEISKYLLRPGGQCARWLLRTEQRAIISQQG